MFILLQLQLVFKSAARWVTLAPKSNHLTHIIRKMHWLPVSARNDSKILLVV